MQPGGPQKVWMQSQTTYAKILKDEARNWQVAVLKQKIWAMGTSYELQEIYGMEQAAAAAKEKNVCLTPLREIHHYISDIHDLNDVVKPY